MHLVTSTKELSHAIGSVARSAGYTTTFYASPAQAENWVESQSLVVIRSEQAVLILRREKKFHRLYHVARDATALANALAALPEAVPEATIVADVIGTLDIIRPVVGAYTENAFTQYKRLSRMYRLKQRLEGFAGQDAEVVCAAPMDVELIQAFLDSHLDPLFEQIPSLSQLNDAISSGSLLVTRQSADLTGVLIFNTIGLTTTLRYWHVSHRQRNRGVGARLMREFLRRCESSARILLWVISDNADAISKYRHYGFQEDVLVDDIVVRQMWMPTP